MEELRNSSELGGESSGLPANYSEERKSVVESAGLDPTKVAILKKLYKQYETLEELADSTKRSSDKLKKSLKRGPYVKIDKTGRVAAAELKLKIILEESSHLANNIEDIGTGHKVYSPYVGDPIENVDNRLAFETIDRTLEDKIFSFEKFYKENSIKLPSDFRDKALDIWRRNQKEMVEEVIGEFGFDEILIIPDTLPSLDELNAKMTSGYEKETNQSDNFKSGGSFAGVKEIPKTSGFKLVLVHSRDAQNLKDHPLLAKTLNQSALDLSGLTASEFQKHITNGTPIPVFVTKDDGTKIEAEGLSLSDYLLFQRKYFEETGKHLDEVGWTWLPSAFSSSYYVVAAGWDDDSNRLCVGTGYVDQSRATSGYRLSRSFK